MKLKKYGNKVWMKETEEYHYQFYHTCTSIALITHVVILTTSVLALAIGHTSHFQHLEN